MLSLRRAITGLLGIRTDQEVRELIQRHQAERDKIESRIQEIAKVTLDSEDSWLRDVANRDPMCFIEAASRCHKG